MFLALNLNAMIVLYINAFSVYLLNYLNDLIVSKYFMFSADSIFANIAIMRDNMTIGNGPIIHVSCVSALTYKLRRMIPASGC